MNEYVEKLYRIGQQDHRLIVGLMSGTSMDGLDIALCRIAGNGRNTVLDMLRFETKSYSNVFRNQIRSIFSKRSIDQQVLCGLHALVGQTHGALVNETLRQWEIPNDEIDLIASHGQTVFHAPQSLTGNRDYPNSTLQIGDGDHLAVATGIITISDFRQKHIAAGGEGAPLAAYGDYLLFVDRRETRVLLNIGGIANFTLLPAIDSGHPCFATDVGPGNTLMDQYMQAKLGLEMDRNAGVAATGTINEVLLRALLDHSFFDLPFPKTTGPELFNLQYLAESQQATQTGNLSENDVMATLSAFSALAIVASIQRAAGQYKDLRVYVSGGGLHNPLLLGQITDGLAGIPVAPFDELGLLPDAKEAALFALLANETVAGAAVNAAAIMDAPAVCMGKISFPV
jgi:anhydro-N-acetylmuramic acid kinase